MSRYEVSYISNPLGSVLLLNPCLLANFMVSIELMNVSRDIIMAEHRLGLLTLRCYHTLLMFTSEVINNSDYVVILPAYV